MIRHFSLLLCLTGMTASAQSYIYNFSGQVTDTSVDIGGIIAGQGLQIGSPVNYSFLVDFGSPGTITLNDGSTAMMEDAPLSNLHFSYFYAEFLSGTQIHAKDGGSLHGPSYTASINYGFDSSGVPPHEGALFGGSANEGVYVLERGEIIPRVSEWGIGDVFEAGARANDSQFHDSLMVSSVTLTSIVAVPEPSAYALSVWGAGLLLAIQRVKKLKLPERFR